MPKVEKLGCEVGLLWVPWHAGVKGNDIVDKIANGSAQKECTVLKVLLGRLEYYSMIRKGLKNVLA